MFVSLDGQGTADATLYTAQAVLQSGATALETLLEMRTLTVSLLVTGRTRQELDENLLALNRLVNPLLGPTEITYTTAAGTYRIEGYLDNGLTQGARPSTRAGARGERVAALHLRGSLLLRAGPVRGQPAVFPAGSGSRWRSRRRLASPATSGRS